MQPVNQAKVKATFSYLWIETVIDVFCHGHDRETDDHDCDCDCVTVFVHDDSHADLKLHNILNVLHCVVRG